MKEIASLATMDSNERESTQQEVDLLSAMSHPNIVGYRDSFVNDAGHLCIFMEYCEHGDMHTYLQDAKKAGKMPSEHRVQEWLVQIVLALHALHVRKILHRDLKTQNIFLAGSRPQNAFALKLGDFGIAKVLNSTTDLAMTQIGTPFYMSPELFNNKPYGYKSDVWGLGCVLYEVVNGQRPFDAQSINGLALKVLKGRYTPITAGCSEETKCLIKSMLSTNPAHRPTLQEVLHNSSIRLRIRPAMDAVITAGFPEMKSFTEQTLIEQLSSLGLGGLVNGPSGAGPRRDRRQLLQRLERAERRRKRQEDTLRRLQETALLLASYLQDDMAPSEFAGLAPGAPPSMPGSAAVSAASGWRPGGVPEFGSESEIGAGGGPWPQHAAAPPLFTGQRTSDPTSEDDMHTDDPYHKPAMSHRDRVLLRKERRREEEQQRFEEEARKIREENLAYQRAWVQGSKDPLGQFSAREMQLQQLQSVQDTTMQGTSAADWAAPSATASVTTAGPGPWSQGPAPALPAASLAGGFGTSSSSQAQPPGPGGGPGLAPLLGYGHIKKANLANPFQSCRPNVVHSPRKARYERAYQAEPRPPRPQFGHEPLPPQHDVPPPATGRWSHWSRSDPPNQTARSIHSICLEALSSDGFSLVPEHSEDSDRTPVDVDHSEDCLSDVGSRISSDEQVRRQSQIVQQRIDACRAAIFRHKMTIETLQYSFSQEEEGLAAGLPSAMGGADDIASQALGTSHMALGASATTGGFQAPNTGRRRGAGAPAIVQDRIARLKRRCLEGLGSDKFQAARQCLQSLLAAGEVAATVRQQMLVTLGLDKIGFYSLIDQIIYMEWRWGECFDDAAVR